jgi:hypothetical protein
MGCFASDGDERYNNSQPTRDEKLSVILESAIFLSTFLIFSDWAPLPYLLGS